MCGVAAVAFDTVTSFTRRRACDGFFFRPPPPMCVKGCATVSSARPESRYLSGSRKIWITEERAFVLVRNITLWGSCKYIQGSVVHRHKSPRTDVWCVWRSRAGRDTDFGKIFFILPVNVVRRKYRDRMLKIVPIRLVSEHVSFKDWTWLESGRTSMVTIERLTRIERAQYAWNENIEESVFIRINTASFLKPYVLCWI